MRFINCLRKSICLDLKNGFFRRWIVLAAPVIFGTVSFENFWRHIQLLVRDNQMKISEITFGDCWMYVYGGMKVYMQHNDKFSFPVIWMLLFMLGMFLVLNYPFKDLQSVGQQVLVRMGGRLEWWLSKCIWNLVSTFYYHGMILLILMGLCRINGISIALKVNLMLLCQLFDIAGLECFLDNTSFTVIWLLLPVCMAAALSLLQMMMALYLGPLISFLISTIILIISAYLFLPSIPGNYMMALRAGWLLRDGMKSTGGYIMVFGIVVIASVLGYIKFKKHYDIVGGENN